MNNKYDLLHTQSFAAQIFSMIVNEELDQLCRLEHALQRLLGPFDQAGTASNIVVAAEAFVAEVD